MKKKYFLYFYFFDFFIKFFIFFLFIGNSIVHATVITSIRPLGFIASAIAEGVMPVEILLPNGASPHDYTLRPSDLIRMKKASILVWIGPEMESFLSSPISSLKNREIITLSKVSTIIPLLVDSRKFIHNKNNSILIPLHQRSEENKSRDIFLKKKKNGINKHQVNMHIWLSPKIANCVAIEIYNRLLLLFPNHKKKLDENLIIFQSILSETDRKISLSLSHVKDKGYYVFHDAYRYFEEHYGLKPLGYFTFDPNIHPGAKTIHNIRSKIMERKSTCIFMEPQFKCTVIKTIFFANKVYIGLLDPLGTNVPLSKKSYSNFLEIISNQYINCLEKIDD
ncbi:zinc ABC transporter substrate-binding protein ZnuA [Candidatus Schneideria nysicola]|uniref:zinc ABC transporter substrate-binding protein ZnuA n=1 Tax=Candidatus Schneideria nysicola TaxID=1081631 RepID=UPI001CAA7842|nr:zinc ABC transporter substrate-binding protein ZnuA [Candidatus Schneideria nysicola]UAJ64897.1 zinc ABC transporter substrate-binding protein ZnuA [Candidatus Schneideria nysicola]